MSEEMAVKLLFRVFGVVILFMAMLFNYLVWTR